MRLISTIYIALLLLVGCEQDTLYRDFDSSSDVVLLNLGISTKATEPDNNSLGLAEDEINTLRVFVFDGGGYFEKQQFFNSSDARNGVYEMEVERSDDKDLYFVVNEPSAISDDLDDVTTSAALQKVEFTIANFLNGLSNGNVSSYDSGSFSMPMSAYRTGIDATQDVTISVEATRCVARVDLYLGLGELDSKTITSGSTFTVTGICDEALVVAPLTISSTSQGDDVTVTTGEIRLESTTKRVLSFYVAERKYDYENSPITISLDGDDGFTITLGDEGDELSSSLSQITRNYVYQITAKYANESVSTEVITDYQIIEWDYVYPDGDMGGVILAVEGVIAMDWFRNGYSYTSPATAFGGDRDIEILLPQERYDDGTYLYLSDYGSTSILLSSTSSFSNLNLLGYTTYDNQSTLGWLTSARMTASSYVGYATFTYEPKDIPYENETFPIRFKSENVIKTMKVVYDNGYISQEFIPDETVQALLTSQYGIGFDWIEGVTNGLIFAKRGEYLHPATTEDVFYAEYDGGIYYYTNEATVTYNSADQTIAYNDTNGNTVTSDPLDYCKQIGSEWYLPPVDMLRMVQLKGQELGTSYRFENTEGALYLGWTEEDGNIVYKAVPMSESLLDDLENQWKVGLDPQAVADKGTYKIRCILNM